MATVDNVWLELAKTVHPEERARLLANPEPTPSTTVDPELTEAMAKLRYWIERSERIRYAARYARRYDKFRAINRLDALATYAQCQIEGELERVESLVAGGRAKP